MRLSGNDYASVAVAREEVMPSWCDTDPADRHACCRATAQATANDAPTRALWLVTHARDHAVFATRTLTPGPGPGPGPGTAYLSWTRTARPSVAPPTSWSRT